MLRGLRNFLNTDKPEHHSTDRLKERGVEKGSGRQSTLQGRERFVFNQANIGTVSRATLGGLLRDGAERVWAFPSATMPSWAETETETGPIKEQIVSQRRICWDKYICCHTESGRYPAFYLIQSRYFDTMTSYLSSDPVTPGVGWLVGCLTSQQHASVSQGRICSDSCTCCHTEIQATDQTCSTSLSYSILTPGRPVTALTLYRQTPGRVVTAAPVLKSMVRLDPEKSRAATLRQKVQLRHSISPSHGIRAVTLGQKLQIKSSISPSHSHTGPTSPSVDPLTAVGWQGDHCSNRNIIITKKITGIIEWVLYQYNLQYIVLHDYVLSYQYSILINFN